MFNFSKHKLQEATPLETAAKAQENAAMSVQKQKEPGHTVRQKNQSAAKQGVSQKSNVVYASEDYFSELNRTKEIYKAQEKARVDWRADLAEAKEKQGAEDEGTHPYVSVMPHTNSQEKQQKKQLEMELKKDKDRKERFDMPESFIQEHDSTKDKAIAKIPGQLEASVKKHAEQAKALRKAGIGEEVDHFDIFCRFVDESASNPFQIHFDDKGKAFTNKGTKREAERRAKNRADNMKSGPMAQDPYKGRAGESD